MIVSSSYPSYHFIMFIDVSRGIQKIRDNEKRHHDLHFLPSIAVMLYAIAALGFGPQLSWKSSDREIEREASVD